MGEYVQITPPNDEADSEGARRVFKEFFVMYQPALVQLEHYMEEIIEEAGPCYAQAYKPWHKALHDLFQGVYLVSKRIPLPNPENLLEALKTFRFESAIQFICHLCSMCHIHLQRDWPQRFREHIDTLLFSLSILHRDLQPSLSR